MTQELLTPSVVAASEEIVRGIAAQNEEPAWLLDERLKAWRTFESMDFPDEYDEEWRRTDVRALPLEGLALQPLEVTRSGAGNGVAVAELSAAGWTYRLPEAGLTVEAWPPQPGMAPGLVERLYGAGYFVLPCSVYGTPGSFRFSLLAEPAELRDALRVAAA